MKPHPIWKKITRCTCKHCIFTSETLFPYWGRAGWACGRFGSEICQAKWESWSFSFPCLFSLMIFWFTAFKSCNSYNSASGWTVGTSQWLYASAVLCASFQAVCQAQLWEVVPHQRASRPDLNGGDSRQQRGWNTAWSWLQSLGHSKIELKLSSYDHFDLNFSECTLAFCCLVLFLHMVIGGT